MIFFDASAVAKRYFAETGSERVTKLWQKRELFSSLAILGCELNSALNRKARERSVSRTTFRSIKNQITHDLRTLHLVPIDAVVIQLCLSLLDSHALRTIDGLYLAGALSLQKAAKDSVLFVSADRQLLRAAASERLQTLDPEMP